ncbi:hypothetical protein [Pseudosulfitobacter sp. DSM 107133]|uniref:hypothetical protein n=1 Tax=Pseudosulfitobacter sp. DSM 107133 TaxID=2883100 RepID=UPI0013B4690C|nr:hypothetical protein [Pseudosulfitobacter sp. DSM 107133]UOA26405.1 hypothetical protein DSM107133_01105 [Pseudosulfitobacter sp. DSM 107133]
MKDHLSHDSLDADVLARLARSGSAPDANNRTTISGFDPAEDVLLIAVPAGQDAAITGQKRTRAGLVVTFSTGASVLLEGLDTPVDEAAVTFVEEEEETPDSDPDSTTASAPDTAPETRPETAADTSGVLYYGSYTTRDGQPRSYMGTRDIPADPPAGAPVTGNVTLHGFTPGTDCIAIVSDTPEALSMRRQKITAQGLRITLSNGVTLTLPGVDTPVEQADIVFVATGTALPE